MTDPRQASRRRRGLLGLVASAVTATLAPMAPPLPVTRPSVEVPRPLVDV